ncbi:hypothetical protein LMH87_004921 [Akanthomyces muscarius]|uniref:Uncharacterized protein n=1 Tax=Akanthomyces muscarius TaxID=2231603 RepID=A0A9W8UNR8_AKAMU|nr:hypothetical protein LMH87_004921 [Akanthomyces muscarius]KAJ4163177.1 hypothetical protein LMH87_004921 [Akanthomyces muscarius]
MAMSIRGKPPQRSTKALMDLIKRSSFLENKSSDAESFIWLACLVVFSGTNRLGLGKWRREISLIKWAFAQFSETRVRYSR